MKNFKDKLIESAKDKGYEEPLFNEEEMTTSQKAKKEKIVIAMKDKESYFKKKYGKRWKEVMHATATKQAMAEELGYSDDVEELDEGAYDLTDPKHPTFAKRYQGYLKHNNIQHSSVSLQGFIKNGGKSTTKSTNEETELEEGDCVSKPEAKKIAKKEVGKHKKEMHKEDINSSEITTDMIQGRVAGGKDNSFKKFKVKLKGDGVVRPNAEIPQQTSARSSIEAHGGAVPQPQIKVGEEIEEATDTVVKDADGNVVSWSHSGDWKKINPKKNPEGKVRNLVGKALKKTKELTKEEMDEAKDPNIDCGCGSQPDFVTNGSQKMTPLSIVKDLAKKSLTKVKKETLGVAPSNQ